VQTCPDCGRDRSAGFARCGYCGHLFADGEPMPDVSRTVTILTSDLQGSTALGEKLDPESLREVLDLYFDAMRLVLEAHGGTIEKIIGDAILAVFGLSDTRADHAFRAVRAAAEGQVALRALNARLDARWGIQLSNRTGIASGVLVVRAAGAREHILTGDVVAISGRLEQSAPPLEALLDEPTYAAAGAMAAVVAEPFLARPRNAEPMAAFRLVSVDPAEAAPAAPSSAEAAGGRTCPNCGTANPGDFRLCGGCGAPLLVARAAATRKTVTIVFAAFHVRDPAGGPLAPDAQRAVMARAFEASREALARHGGTIEKFIGDAVMAVFGLPMRHEDDALRAVRAALDLQAALRLLAAALKGESAITLEVAMGVNTGEVITGEAALGQRLVTGDAVNVAARLEQAAPAGGILVGGLTATLVRGVAHLEQVASLAVKGKSEPVPAHRLLGVLSASGPARRSATALVGRETEIRLLADAFDAAVDGRTCRIVTLVGDAGVGKTRLAAEFLDAARSRATVVSGRCLPYGDGITFWPIVEIVRSAASLRESDTPSMALRKLRRLVGDDAVVERVAAAAGLRDAPFQVGELFWGIRRFLEILAARTPLVVVFDDIHWAEPTFLDLLGHLTATAHDQPILLLCMARSELFERRPSWGQAPGEGTIVLAPLSDEDAARVIENLLGRIGLADSVRDRIVAAAEGNPLFVEQLVSMLQETGALRLAGDRWEPAGDLASLAIPPTIHALLAARLDALPECERAVADPASVIGLVFARLALEALVEDDVRDELTERLGALTARQFVRPMDAAAGEDSEYRFAHLMIRDATYAGLLKRTRARLHERFVAWADEANRATDRAAEFEEILGYHLEQAHRYLAELGPLDEHGVAVGIDASGRLASAGQRALVRGDMPATANLVRRAAALLPEDHAARPRLSFELALALREVGERDAAQAALGSAAEGAARLGDVGLETTARLERLMTQYWADPSKIEGDIEERIRSSIAELERAGDEAGLARAWLTLAGVRVVDARWGVAAEAVELVIEHARRAGDRILEIRAGPNLALCAELGPTPVPEAIRLCEDVIGRLGGDRKAEAVTLRSLAHLHAMRGEFETAREEYRRSRAMLEELGWRFHAALTSITSGLIEMLAGDPLAAEAELRGDYATLEELGDRNYISTVAAYLAEALYRQGRDGEADAMASFGAEVAAPDDVATQIALRRVRGRLLARAGRAGEAESLCREAVEMSRTEDDPADQAATLTALADVLRASARDVEAAATETAALALYEAKGDIVSAAAARRSLAGGRLHPAGPLGPEEPGPSLERV
jgi:class 3 adenylate cyclase/tetratricopeptide (TPR) repeat protein